MKKFCCVLLCSQFSFSTKRKTTFLFFKVTLTNVKIKFSCCRQTSLPFTKKHLSIKIHSCKDLKKPWGFGSFKQSFDVMPNRLHQGFGLHIYVSGVSHYTLRASLDNWLDCCFWCDCWTDISLDQFTKPDSPQVFTGWKCWAQHAVAHYHLKTKKR